MNREVTADEKIRQLQDELTDRTREVVRLRSLLERIHALSDKSLYESQAQRVREARQETKTDRPDFTW